MGKVISISEIVACNKHLKEMGLEYQVHVRDACGRQTCWIEPLNQEGREKDGQMRKALEGFFKGLGYLLEYGPDKMDFWVRQ